MQPTITSQEYIHNLCKVQFLINTPVPTTNTTAKYNDIPLVMLHFIFIYNKNGSVILKWTFLIRLSVNSRCVDNVMETHFHIISIGKPFRGGGGKKMSVRKGKCTVGYLCGYINKCLECLENKEFHLINPHQNYKSRDLCEVGLFSYNILSFQRERD